MTNGAAGIENNGDDDDDFFNQDDRDMTDYDY